MAPNASLANDALGVESEKDLRARILLLVFRLPSRALSHPALRF